jgi:flagellar P-ring protein precursor FlgI
MTGWIRTALAAGLALAAFAAAAAPARAEKIKDVVRMKTDVPNSLVGIGLVVGLNGTGDGGDFGPTVRPLKEYLKRMDDQVNLDKELKNANNCAIVSLQVSIPTSGVHSGEQLDVHVSAIAAKSLRGGRLIVCPLFSPQTNAKIVLGSAVGLLTVAETVPTQATISKGAAVIQDILPEEIQNNRFTLAIDPDAASYERASAIADQINQEVAPQTEGRPVAQPDGASSVIVDIPPAERARPERFISWVLSLKLPDLPGEAVIRINEATQTIILSDEVELSPRHIVHKNVVIEITEPPAPPAGAARDGSPASRPGNAKLRDLLAAFDLMKVSPADRIAIVKELKKDNALKGRIAYE